MIFIVISMWWICDILWYFETDNRDKCMDSRAQGRNHASKVGGEAGNSGEARIRGAKRLRFEGGAQIEGEAREKAGRGQTIEGAQWVPP